MALNLKAKAITILKEQAEENHCYFCYQRVLKMDPQGGERKIKQLKQKMDL